MNFKIGKIYELKAKYWFIFPSKELAAIGTDEGITLPLRENVSTFGKNSLVIFLEEDGDFKKLLTSDGTIGWVIIYDQYLACFEEVKIHG